MSSWGTSGEVALLLHMVPHDSDVRFYCCCLQWFEAHYGVAMGRKKGAAIAEDDPLNKKKSKHVERKHASRKEGSKVDVHLEQQFTAGRIYACISSRPGQCGRADGYILEGKELDFYLRKLRSHKH